MKRLGDWNGGVVPNTLRDIIKVQMLYLHTHHIMLSGWWLSHPSEKYEFVSWDYYSQCIYIYIYILWKNKTCSKPHIMLYKNIRM